MDKNMILGIYFLKVISMMYCTEKMKKKVNRSEKKPLLKE